MKSLLIQCFGEFEVRFGDERVSGFESQKVRALLAYLACHADRALSRDQMAAFLWPEKGEEAARRNLRQALYNIRHQFPGNTQPMETTRQEIRFSSKIDWWVDVLSFEEALDESKSSERGHPHLLTEAVGLYRGDFLAGFHVKGSSEFDSWLLAEQERLRERAISALRRLVDNYLARGSFRLGLQYAQRLVALDPMSEDAHRKLMQLYVLSGRRGRALGQYAELETILEKELGVEPMEETQNLRQRVLNDESAIHVAEAQEATLGPIIPLVCRREEYEALGACMTAARTGKRQLTLISGESGIGKSRLARSFLDALGSTDNVAVLKGRCFREIPSLLEPFSNVTQNAVNHEDRRVRQIAGESEELLAALSPLNPTDDPARRRSARSVGKIQSRIFEALAELLRRLAGPVSEGEDFLLVLMLDDLEHADPAAIELLRFLETNLVGYRVWIVAAFNLDAVERHHPIQSLEKEIRSERPDQLIELSRLPRRCFEEIASSLVGVHQAPLLAGFLERRASRLPLQITEWVNHLWDEGLLVSDFGRWHLLDGLDEIGEGLEDVEELVLRRLQHLPSSTRRVAFMAAMSGPNFETDLVTAACGEHPTVVEIGLSLLIERWMVRRYTDEWQDSSPERHVFLWSQGTRQGQFEFSSRLIRRAIHDSIDPERRKTLHDNIGRLIEDLHGQDGEFCELLAFHFGKADNHEKAWKYMLASGDRAYDAAAPSTAKRYYRSALECITHLGKASDDARALARQATILENRLNKVA